MTRLPVFSPLVLAGMLLPACGLSPKTGAPAVDTAASIAEGVVQSVTDTGLSALRPDSGDTAPAEPVPTWTLASPSDSARTWLVSPEGQRVFSIGVNAVMRATTCDGMDGFIRRTEPARAAARSWARLSTGDVNGEEVGAPYCFTSVGAFSETNDFDDSGGDSWMIRPVEQGGAGAPYTSVLNPAATGDAWSLRDEHGTVLRPGYAGYRMGDPYNPEFLADIDALVARDVVPRASDPQLQMWFLGNELGIWDRTDPEVSGVRDFRRHLWSDCPTGSTVDTPLCAPHALAAFLRDHYGSLGTLNDAWESDYPGADFAVIVDEGPRPVPYVHDCNQACRDDLQRFVHDELLARWVFETTTRVRAADPHHLLSSPRLALSNDNHYRFWSDKNSDQPDVWADDPSRELSADKDEAPTNPFDLLARRGDSGFDLVSVNVYTGRETFPEPWLSDGLTRIHEHSGLPVYVSELGVRARIEGWTNEGGALAFVPSTDDVNDQEQRGLHYESQVRQLVGLPFVVGVAWHAWSDRFLADDPARQLNTGLMQCDDLERGLSAGTRWSRADDGIAATNCEIEAILDEETGL